ncbi:MAG: hypothetical protein ACREVB_06580, partial [Burkholderiales bacterium]
SRGHSDSPFIAGLARSPPSLLQQARNFLWPTVVEVCVRIHITLVVNALILALAAPGSAAQSPPANSGCGEAGPTMSEARPTVRLTSTTLRLRDTGRVRIHLRGNQTAAMTVKIAQVGGKRVGGTTEDGYACATPRAAIVAVPLNAYGRRLVRRHGRLEVKLMFRLINGSGVTNTRSLGGVIRPG